MGLQLCQSGFDFSAQALQLVGKVNFFAIIGVVVGVELFGDIYKIALHVGKNHDFHVFFHGFGDILTLRTQGEYFVGRHINGKGIAIRQRADDDVQQDDADDHNDGQGGGQHFKLAVAGVTNRLADVGIVFLYHINIPPRISSISSYPARVPSRK